MKIAIFHELPRGGARRAINAYSRILKKNHKVDLFLTDEAIIDEEKKFYNNIFLHKFTPKVWLGNDWKIRLYKDTIELFRLATLHKKIASYIDNKKYDFVLVSASKYIEAPFILRYLKTPFLFYCQDPNYRLVYDDLLGIDDKLDPFRKVYEKYNRYIRKMLDKQNIDSISYALSPSNFIAQEFTKTYKKKCRVVYYGVDHKFFVPGNHKKNKDIFYIGSRHPIDGYDFLLDTISFMSSKPKTELLLTDEKWIFDDVELRDMYRNAKVFVCTALKEGLGASALEAMSSGVPVLAVDEAGHKETVIDGKTGFLIERNSKIFAGKLDWLLSNHKVLKELSNNARRIIVERWTWEKRTKELEKAIVEFLGK